jgi:hypothetical protein
MATGQNFYFQGNPGSEIGAALGTALFGDPAARAKQQQLQSEMELRRAQADEARAHGTLYGNQADGVRLQTHAAAGLPALFASMTPQPAAPVVAAAPDGSNLESAFDSSVGPQAQPETQEQAIHRGLPGLLAALAQMNGKDVDPRQIMGTYGAFMGGDELARRGIAAQGNSPSENFALTPQRADAISARDANFDLTKSIAVARANHATDIPVANIHAGASRYGNDRQLEGTRYTVDHRPAPQPPAPKPPRLIGAKATDDLNDMIDDFEKAHHVSITGTTRASVLAKAVTAYQQTGNMEAAIAQATGLLSVDGQDAGDRDEHGDGPPVRGAQKAPDGNWYVQTGQNPDGSPAYSRVGEEARNWQLPNVSVW